jgi:hypothetical protein
MGSVPSPDPTVLTTQNLQREIGAVKELLELQIDALRDKLEDTVKLTEAKRIADKEAVEIAKTASETAINKAETANEKRFESVNEFRKQLSDQTARFLTRDVYDYNHEALEKMVQVSLPREVFDRTLTDWQAWREAINSEISQTRGKQAAYAGLIAFIVVVANIFGFIVGQ